MFLKRSDPIELNRRVARAGSKRLEKQKIEKLKNQKKRKEIKEDTKRGKRLKNGDTDTVLWRGKRGGNSMTLLCLCLPDLFVLFNYAGNIYILIINININGNYFY